MDTLDPNQAGAFFQKICQQFRFAENVSSVIVTHLLRDRPFLINALNQQTALGLILAKPKSVHQETKHWLSKQFSVQIARNRFDDGERAVKLISKHCNGRPVVLLDIGGYFADVVDFISTNYSGGLFGIVEDTENGIQKYERQARLTRPIISVARSPLKNPEDYLVGQSIVFSTEALLREQGDILHGRTACVIGYGKLGRSIGNLLHARHVRTVIYDLDPIRSVEAMSHGFTVAPSLSKGLSGAGLVFCATGNTALKKSDFELVEDGAYIATVTSSDDELALDDIRDNYQHKQVTDYITRYQKGGRHFYMLNRGQAVNFIHGAAVGPFIYLVQGELLASAARLTTDSIGPGIFENDTKLRQSIAEIWLDCFGPKPMRRVVDV